MCELMHAHVCEEGSNIPRTGQQCVNTSLGMRKDGSQTVTESDRIQQTFVLFARTFKQ